MPSYANTTCQWYRLALNSVPLGPLLSSHTHSQPRRLEVWRLQCLETSLTAASQILISLSSHGRDYVWNLDSQNTSTFPVGPITADAEGSKRLFYAVDSTWISHTFAVTFVVLCYVRGVIDGKYALSLILLESTMLIWMSEELQINTLNAASSPQPPTYASLTPNSMISRLLRLALEVFDGVCKSPAFHPAQDFQAVVHNASSLILNRGHLDTQEGQNMNDSAIQSLLDLMNDSGLEWPGNYLDLSVDWDVERTLSS